MIECKNCILTSKFPSVKIDDEGVCNYCREEENKTTDNNYSKEENKFKSYLKKRVKNSEYDGMLCFSGGKDSTYTLYLLKKKYNLNILTYTFDNGFLSEHSIKNIHKVTDELGVDNIILRPNKKLMVELFKHGIKNKDLYSQSTICKGSNVCTICINFVRYSALKIAYDKKVDTIYFGWTQGQVSKKEAVYKLPKAFFKTSQQNFIKSINDILPESYEQYFLNGIDLADAERQIPTFVNPILFEDYDIEKINSVIKEIGWCRPDDTDANSTNCLINSLGNYVHVKQFGFNPYTFELSELIRKRNISKETAKRKLETKNETSIIDKVLADLNDKELINIYENMRDVNESD